MASIEQWRRQLTYDVSDGESSMAEIHRKVSEGESLVAQFSQVARELRTVEYNHSKNPHRAKQDSDGIEESFLNRADSLRRQLELVRAEHDAKRNEYNHEKSALESVARRLESLGSQIVKVRVESSSIAESKEACISAKGEHSEEVTYSARIKIEEADRLSEECAKEAERLRRIPPFPELEIPSLSFSEGAGRAWSEFVAPALKITAVVAERLTMGALRVATGIIKAVTNVGFFMAGLIGRSAGALRNSFQKMPPPTSFWERSGPVSESSSLTSTARRVLGAIGSGDKGAELGAASVPNSDSLESRLNWVSVEARPQNPTRSSDYSLDSKVVAAATRRWEKSIPPKGPSPDELHWRREGYYKNHREMESRKESMRGLHRGHSYQ